MMPDRGKLTLTSSHRRLRLGVSHRAAPGLEPTPPARPTGGLKKPAGAPAGRTPPAGPPGRRSP